MPRISPATREQLAPEEQQYYDAIVGSRGSIRGPYGVLLNSPKLAARVADTGSFVRFEFDVPEKYAELRDRHYARPAAKRAMTVIEE